MCCILRFRQQRSKSPFATFEKAVALEEGDFATPGMLITCYTALGMMRRLDGRRNCTGPWPRRFLAHDPNNGSA